MPRNGIIRPYSSSIFNNSKSLSTDFHNVYCSLHPSPATKKGTSIPSIDSLFGLCSSLFSFLTAVSWNHKMISIFTSLVTKDAECLKKKQTNIYLLSMSFFENCQLISLVHLLRERQEVVLFGCFLFLFFSFFVRNFFLYGDPSF